MLKQSFLWGLVSMLGYGFTDFFAGRASREVKEWVASFYNYLIGSLFVLVIYIFFRVFLKEELFPGNLTAISFLAALGAAVSLFIGVLSLLIGVQTEKIGLVSGIVSTYGLVAASLGIFFFGEEPAPVKILSMLLVGAGVILISVDVKRVIENRRLLFTSKGALWGISGSLFFGLSGFLSVVAGRELGWFFPLFLINVVSLALALIVVLFKKIEVRRVSLRAFRWIFLSTLAEQAGVFGLMYGGMVGLLSVTGAVSSTYAAITVLLAWIILKEKLSRFQLACLSLIILGLVGLSR